MVHYTFLFYFNRFYGYNSAFFCCKKTSKRTIGNDLSKTNDTVFITDDVEQPDAIFAELDGRFYAWSDGFGCAIGNL